MCSYNVNAPMNEMRTESDLSDYSTNSRAPNYFSDFLSSHSVASIFLL